MLLGVSKGDVAPLEGVWGNPQPDTMRVGGWERSLCVFSLSGCQLMGFQMGEAQAQVLSLSRSKRGSAEGA